MPRAEHSRVVDAVTRQCDAATDSASLRAAVIDLLRTAIRFDSYVWVLTDPVTAVGCAPYARMPRIEALPAIIRSKYLTPELRWTSLDGTGRLSDLRSDEALDWRAALGMQSVTDVASAVHKDRYGTWAFLDLWTSSGVFSDDAMDLMGRIRLPLTAALRRCQALTMSDVPAPEDRPTGTVVALVDDRLRVVGEVAAAAEWLARLLPPTRNHPPIPAVVYNVAAQLIARERNVDDNPAFARLHIADGHWISVHAARLRGEHGPELIAVSLHGTTPIERLEVFTRANGLSERETEVVGLLASGLDTAQLAQRIHVSPLTVQDHLKSIFDRTGTRSRPALLARALGSGFDSTPGPH